MTTAGVSHWWSLQQFLRNSGHNSQTDLLGMIGEQAKRLVDAASATTTAPRPPAAPTQSMTATAPSDLPNAEQQKFYAALIAKINTLQAQNRDLLDQMAETNRDIMKLEFRVDTHSESFRPLPVSEDLPLTRLTPQEGVLPPRAQPVPE